MATGIKEIMCWGQFFLYMEKQISSRVGTVGMGEAMGIVSHILIFVHCLQL